jgi:hypothetical protein
MAIFGSVCSKSAWRSKWKCSPRKLFKTSRKALEALRFHDGDKQTSITMYNKAVRVPAKVNELMPRYCLSHKLIY